MPSTTRVALSLTIVALLTAAFIAPTAGARPVYIDDRGPGLPDPRSILWEPKQAAFEKLQAALAAPVDAVRASQADYDVYYYDLDIEVDEGPETVDGYVIMRATSNVDGLTTVIMDLYGNMTVDAVEHGGSAASYTHNGDLITVTLNSTVNTGGTFEVKVTYHGAPVDDALNFSTHGAGGPIISSLSEPSGARQWWPCKDTPADKADSVRVALTVDDALIAVSNGMLISEVDNGTTKTYEWFETYPITTYLVSVAISDYSTWTDYYNYARGSMPIENYVYPEHLSNAQEDLNITAQAIGVLSGYFGEYPFIDERYGHAVFPWGGAMEHQTCTSYGRVLIRGDHYYDWILVHELAHQWWGDWVTCETWNDIWLNEGFATYSEALWFESLGGETDYDDYIDAYDSYGYFNGPIYDPDSTFNRTVYDKGALVLHMLRRVLELGNGTVAHYPIDALQAVLASYSAANAYDTALTSEFQTFCEASYGGDMDWFFLPWVYGANRPHYEFSWIASYDGPPYEIMLHIEQVQTNAGLFTMPVDIEVQTTGADTLITVWNDEWSQDFFFAVNDPPSDVNLDPGNWILKYLTQSSTGVNGEASSVALHVPTNPTGADARLSYSIPAAGHVDLRVYDVSGRLVRTLVNGGVAAGVHGVTWDGVSSDGARAASGVYFVRLTSERGAATNRLVLLR
ncbi:MAG: M1 family aminopeptidase [Candidatus Eisenbacteria bacterium]